MKCSNGGIVASLRAGALSFSTPSDEVSVNNRAKGGLMRGRLNTSDIILLTILAGCLLIVDSQILVALR